MYKINWSKFTIEQKTLIQKILAEGDYKKITHVIVVDSPEQEYELQQYVQSIVPQGKTQESKIKEELKKILQRTNELTPEVEAEWQKKLDMENNPKMHREEVVEKVVDEVLEESVVDSTNELTPEVEILETAEESIEPIKRGRKSKK